jgi:hypothetical protein
MSGRGRGKLFSFTSRIDKKSTLYTPPICDWNLSRKGSSFPYQTIVQSSNAPKIMDYGQKYQFVFSLACSLCNSGFESPHSQPLFFNGSISEQK